MVKRWKRKNCLFILLILLLVISVGYAILVTDLNINGSTNIKKATWDIHFENLVKKDGSSSAEKEAEIDVSKTLIEYTVQLDNPGDFYEFTVDIVNKGSIDAMIDTVLKSGLTNEQQKYIEYTATSSNGKELKQHDLLKAGQTRKITVRVKYRDDLNSEDLPKDDAPVGLSFRVNYIQADERAIEIVPSIMKSYSNNSTEDYHSSEYKSKITKVDFRIDEDIPASAIENWDVSEKQDKSVMAYIEDDKTGNGTYSLIIVGKGNVTANRYSNYLFQGFSELREINLSNLDTSNIMNMNDLFEGCSSLSRVDFSNNDLSNVIYMVSVFSGCSSLNSINFGDNSLSGVSDMASMFSNCSNLSNVDFLNKLNLSNARSFSYMFYKCGKLTSVDFSSSDLSKVYNMGGLFCDCTNLVSVNFGNNDLRSVTTMDSMFSGCKSLTNADFLSKLDLSKVTNMMCMFQVCTKLTSVDFGDNDLSGVTNMMCMFWCCTNLVSLNLGRGSLSSVTNTSYMFGYCSNIKTTVTIDSSKITSYERMFSEAATNSGALIIVNYTSNASSIVNSLIATKSANSNVVKGSFVSN